MPSFNMDILHLYLKDSLKRSYIQATASEMPNDDALPALQMTIAPESLDNLNSDLPESGKSDYYRAYVRYNGKSFTVKARYMGDNYWHWLNPQKSWRIKAKKNRLINDSRKLNIKNPRYMLPFNQCIPQDLAREIGLIAPRIFPIKFILNGLYMGVYLFWDPIDENVIRRFKRMPGSIYSGDGAPTDPKSGVSALWLDEKWWEKDGSRNADQEAYRGDIRKLLHAINEQSLSDFYLFCKKHLDQKMFCKLFSLDSLVATLTRDYHHNHKLYFDPYMGKFVPISWDTNDWWLNIRELDTTSNPLLNKWKLIPTFELLRQQTLFNLLQTTFSYENLEKKISYYDGLVRPSLEADATRDAKDYNPQSLLKFGRVAVRPFTMDEYISAVDQFKVDIKGRIRFLSDYLDKSRLLVGLEQREGTSIVRVLVSGNVGRLVTGLRFEGNCPSLDLYRDVNRNSRLDEKDVFIGSGKLMNDQCLINVSEEVLPGYKKVRTPIHKNHGRYILEVSPLEYDYIVLPSKGTIDSVEIVSKSIVTGEPEKSSYGKIPHDASSATISLHP
ncbi:MAG: CotH kinase family protein, partial [Deltaproteobacteria bacterium]|nr:CotH kinase family protein [Deltaproteobacteria bacterium]